MDIRAFVDSPGGPGCEQGGCKQKADVHGFLPLQCGSSLAAACTTLEIRIVLAVLKGVKNNAGDPGQMLWLIQQNAVACAKLESCPCDLPFALIGQRNTQKNARLSLLGLIPEQPAIDLVLVKHRVVALRVLRRDACAFSEDFLHHLGMSAGQHENGGASVSKIVDPNSMDAGLLEDAVKDLAQRVGIIIMTGFSCEDKIVILIAF